MDQTVRDIATGVALFLSSAGLIVSLTVARFNRRTKNAELRAQVMNKYSNTKYALRHFQFYLDMLKIKAQAEGDNELVEFLDRKPDLSAMSKHLDEAIKNLDATPPVHGLIVYETVFHRVSELEADIAEMKGLTDKGVALLKVRQKQSSSAPSTSASK